MTFKARSVMGCAVILAALLSGGVLRGLDFECLDDFEDGSMEDGSPCTWSTSNQCGVYPYTVEGGKLILGNDSEGLAAAWIDAPFTGDVSVRLQATTIIGNNIAAMIHATPCFNLCWGTVNYPGGEVNVGYTVGGAGTYLAAGVLDPPPHRGEVLVLQLDYIGGELQLRVWRPEEEMPEDPLLRATDTTLATTFKSGTAGTYCFGQAVYDGISVFGAPEAAMAVDPESGPAPLQVTVDGSASAVGGTRRIASYNWDFGDGSTAQGVRPAPHTYTQPGEYTIRLAVADDKGLSGSTTRRILVDSAPACTTSFECLDDFEDGSMEDGSPCTWSTSNQCGVYPYTVEGGKLILGNDSDGLAAAWIDAPLTGDVSVRLQATTIIGNNIAAMIHATPCFNLCWGAVNYPGGEVNVGYTVGGAGTYLAAGVLDPPPSMGEVLVLQLDYIGGELQLRVWRPKEEMPEAPLLRATDTTLATTFKSGTAGTYCFGQAVYDGISVFGAPEAAMAVDPESGPAPLQVTVDGSASAVGCSREPASYNWDFGDGSTAQGVRPAPHTYTQPGEYTIRLTVTDTRGLSGHATRKVIVEPPSLHFFRGDSNDDGKIDISDPVFTLSWLFLGGPAPRCVAAANTNGDAAVDISDAVHVLGHLFLGGPAPVAPYPECGPAALAADVALGCESFEGCR